MLPGLSISIGLSKGLITDILAMYASLLRLPSRCFCIGFFLLPKGEVLLIFVLVCMTSTEVTIESCTLKIAARLQGYRKKYHNNKIISHNSSILDQVICTSSSTNHCDRRGYTYAGRQIRFWIYLNLLINLYRIADPNKNFPSPRTILNASNSFDLFCISFIRAPRVLQLPPRIYDNSILNSGLNQNCLRWHEFDVTSKWFISVW